MFMLNITGNKLAIAKGIPPINLYKRKKGPACSKSTQNLFNELQRNDLTINHKLNKNYL